MFLHDSRVFCSVCAYVLLRHHTILIHHIGHDSAHAVLRDRRDQGETVSHQAVHDVAACATGCIGTVCGEDAKVVAAKRSRFASGTPVTLCCSFSGQLSQRAWFLAFVHLPMEAVLLPRLAHELVRVGSGSLAVLLTNSGHTPFGQHGR